MTVRQIFSRGVIRYIIYSYLFLAFTLAFLFAYGRGGHGPFIGIGRFLTFLFCLSSFPASLITLFGFMTGGHTEVVIPLLGLSPLLNGLLIGGYCQYKKGKKGSREDVK